MNRIAVIGAGGWGTALANLMASKGEPVTLWGFEPHHVEELRATRMNTPFLPGVRLHDAITPTADMADVADAELLLVVPPSKGMRGVAGRLADVAPRGVLVSFTKGIEQGSGLRMSEILHQAMPTSRIAVLSGPSHAEEVARSMPTAVVLGCADAALAAQIQGTLNSQTFRVYTSTDVAGIELGGALKNIFAIAAGVSDGLGFGDNSKAALVTRALVELVRLGTALGGRKATFRGLSGIGDLMVTCFSRHSRNRSVGERLGRGETPEQIAASMQMVAEGVPTALSAYECARRLGVETPIIDAVHGLLYAGKSPREVLSEILSREPRPEEE
ncbi:MAG: NAD(P)-dependent glycerol-3-phosphate dehydrogenase [Verrucomicrobia bacterium]|nr:NAD(P)-dependent glycerol-3-phosphate dehydrogenase [Verrucomicrobiota bacterium]